MVYQFRLRNEVMWTARVPIGETHRPPLVIGQTVYLQWAAHDGLALLQ